ncbi:hypothetical protein ES319_A11G201400v1 [Gossypium barbadense]|uniref:Uncharacterized protein n=1 Tax=Gossypium barbadense TaxID=3634 RepID=A0A5J5TSU6_GOSBA|nr:hypothetical protein ES319_A11G201400v1 [Gossypium barbadense]
MRSMVSSTSAKGIAAIVGVGPKLGRSIARKFAHEGYTVAILARDLGRLSRFADEIAREEKAQVFAIRIDCSDSRSVREAFEGVLSLGFVEVLVYNAYQSVSWHPTNITDIKIDSFEKSLAVSSIGAFLCVQKGGSSIAERVGWGTTAKRQSRRGGRGRDDDGPRRLGSNLLALARSRPDRLDPGD